MVVQVGDKVLVYGAGTPWAFAKKIEPVQVGDKVDVVTLSDGTKLAMPKIELDLSDFVWVLPEWDLGFNLSDLPFGWGMMPLGAAVFTLTDVKCLECSDIEREWGPGSLSGMHLILISGDWKGVKLNIVNNSNQTYYVNLDDLPIAFWEKGRFLVWQSGTGDNAGNLGKGEFDYLLTSGGGWVSAALDLAGVTSYKYGYKIAIQPEYWQPPSVQPYVLFDLRWGAAAWARPDLSPSNYTGINLKYLAWENGGWYLPVSDPSWYPVFPDHGLKLVVGHAAVSALGITLSNTFAENRMYECINPDCPNFINPSDSYDDASRKLIQAYPLTCNLCGSTRVPHWAVLVNTNWPDLNYVDFTAVNPSWMANCRVVLSCLAGAGTNVYRRTCVYLNQVLSFDGRCIQCNAGDRYLIYNPATKRLVFNDSNKTILASPYWRDITGPGDEISTTPVTYAWDGQGQVYLSQSKTTLSTIFYDNELQVSNLAAGTTKTIPYHSNDPYTYEGETVSRELVNITSILRAGMNEITLSVRDTTGTKIGFPTPVYLVRSMS